jgi:hypothetical protein
MTRMTKIQIASVMLGACVFLGMALFVQLVSNF